MLLAHQLISVFPVSWTKVCLHLCLEHFQLMFYSQVLLTDHSIQCIACNAFIDPFFLCVWLHLYLMCFERIGLLFQISLVHYIPPPVPSSLVSPVSSCSLWIDRINIFLSLKGKAKKYPHPNTKNPSPITPCPSTSSPGKCPYLHLLTSHSLLHLPPRPLVRPTPSLISLHPLHLCCPQPITSRWTGSCVFLTPAQPAWAVLCASQHHNFSCYLNAHDITAVMERIQ